MTLTAEYALRVVVALGLQPDRYLTTREIAERTKVPSFYLEKVLRTLARAGLIASHRGPGGGFGLGRPWAGNSMVDR